jgi:hypothetical protein
MKTQGRRFGSKPVARHLLGGAHFEASPAWPDVAGDDSFSTLIGVWPPRERIFARTSRVLIIRTLQIPRIKCGFRSFMAADVFEV